MEAGNRLEELYIKWFNKSATPQEKEALIQLLQSGVSKEQLNPVIEKIWSELRDDTSFSIQEREKLADTIIQQWPAEPVVAVVRRIPHYRRKWWMAAAAIVFLVGSVLLWQVLNQKQPASQIKQTTVAGNIDPIPPGKDGAVLTLADGRQIILDSAANGVISSQGQAQITLKNNQVIYNSGSNTETGALAYNTMSTPNGRQFQLVLPDGSKVWLNAASSVKYPVAFSSKERRVEVTGEVYFEVAHNKSWPFIVQTKHHEVQALGTGFNVNAYDNEKIERTTLIEGSVKVSAVNVPLLGNSHPLSTILNPGQQANIDYSNQSLSVANNQAEAAIAWKNGYFNLENMPFDRVMKQLERWYNIEVQYENGVPDLHFVGGLSRNMTLPALLRALQVSEVHFKMEAGHRLIVYK